MGYVKEENFKLYTKAGVQRLHFWMKKEPVCAWIWGQRGFVAKDIPAGWASGEEIIGESIFFC